MLLAPTFVGRPEERAVPVPQPQPRARPAPDPHATEQASGMRSPLAAPSGGTGRRDWHTPPFVCRAGARRWHAVEIDTCEREAQIVTSRGPISELHEPSGQEIPAHKGSVVTSTATPMLGTLRVHARLDQHHRSSSH